ncbi:MAG TPA: PHB depolymerase family esterase, partial [Thermoanaerobaculia bacterium]
EYRIYVPRGLDRSRPAPLVISLHGAGGWPVQQEEMSQWDRIADAQHFIVAYPSGLSGAGPRVWRGTEDVRFISDLIAKLQREYNIDRHRIYANGFSNGGGMSFILSCTMSDRIAAIGLVASAQTTPFSWCTDRRPVAMIAFHGTADPFTRYDGGKTWMAPSPFPGIPRFVANWARRNRCDPRPADASPAADVTRREYVHCAEDASVVLYTIRDGGHTWPGGQPLPEWFVGPTSNSIDATRTMWNFFSQHPLR